MKLLTCRALVTAAFLATLVATPCFGQGGAQGGGRGGRGQGGPGGPGGPGGMMGGGMMGGMMGGGDLMLLGLLRVKEVQEEIEMMPDQIEAVGKVGDKMREVARPDRPQGNSEADREEFMKKMQAFAEEQGKVVSESLEEILLPEQLERARQIALQQQGVQAFYDPSFVKKIELTEEQQAKLKEQQEGMREKMGEAFRGAMQGGDRDAVRKKIEEVRASVFEEAKSVLTSEQKKKYEAMVGTPFKMPEGAMMGGFGGRGQGGPGGAQGGRGGRGGRGGADPGNDA